MIGQNNMIRVFSGFTRWSSFRYTYTIGTLRRSALVDGFAWDVLLSWDIYWFASEGASQRGSPRETQRGEPINIPT